MKRVGGESQRVRREHQPRRPPQPEIDGERSCVRGGQDEVVLVDLWRAPSERRVQRGRRVVEVVEARREGRRALRREPAPEHDTQVVLDAPELACARRHAPACPALVRRLSVHARSRRVRMPSSRVGAIMGSKHGIVKQS